MSQCPIKTVHGVLNVTGHSQRIGFSAVSDSDLAKLGVLQGDLLPKRKVVLKLADALPVDGLHDLRSSISEIYDHINMDVSLVRVAARSPGGQA